MKANVKQQVVEWLQHKDYEAGVVILSGIRPQMSRIMSGRSHRYKDKLEYELLKLIGEDHLTKLALTKHVVEAKPKTVEQARVKQPKVKKKRKRSKSAPVVKTKVTAPPAPAKPEPQPQPKKKPDKAAKKPVSAEQKKEVPGYDLSAAHESLDEVPAEIEKIVKEHSRLFTLRSQLSEERYAVPQTNNDKNMKRRRVLTQSIHELSERIEVLFNAHAEYLKTRKMPNMDALFMAKTPKKQPARKPAPKKPSIADLRRERNTLMAGNRRDKNKLEYQADRKLPKRNPMPEGPKRSQLIKRVADRNRRITQIDKLLKK